jgi:hypothetical protein
MTVDHRVVDHERAGDTGTLEQADRRLGDERAVAAGARIMSSTRTWWAPAHPSSSSGISSVPPSLES